MTIATATQTPAECVLAAAEADSAPAAAALGVGAQQVRNLVRLARHLRATYPHGEVPSFHMGTFYSVEDEGTDREVRRSLMLADPHERVAIINTLQPHECGSVACAVGHGPAAGVPARYNEAWMDYAHRCYLHRQLAGYAALFEGDWSVRDNTARGAAARICYALQHGWQALAAPAVSTSLYKEYLA